MSARGIVLLALAACVAVVLAWLLWRMGLHVYELDVEIEASPTDCEPADVHFAVIGDFGDNGQSAADVAWLVASWEVDFVATVGDNNYPHGAAETIDDNIGAYYSRYIHPYRGRHGEGSGTNRFWPALGNHDWDPGHIEPYLDYFELPGNERYYDLDAEPVHLFVLDSDPNEPDGRTADSLQGRWLAQEIGASTAPWQIVLMHHPPYASSIGRGNDEEVRWPFASWGADAVIAGHDHLYERRHEEGIPYIVNGLGGRSSGFSNIHRFVRPSPGSLVRYNRDYGAMQVSANASCLNLSFFSRRSELIDSLTLTHEEPR